MDTLPPVGRGEVACRRDLTDLAHDQRGGVAEQRGEMTGPTWATTTIG